jgi:hypothetical protein
VVSSWREFWDRDTPIYVRPGRRAGAGKRRREGAGRRPRRSDRRKEPRRNRGMPGSRTRSPPWCRTRAPSSSTTVAARLFSPIGSEFATTRSRLAAGRAATSSGASTAIRGEPAKRRARASRRRGEASQRRSRPQASAIRSAKKNPRRAGNGRIGVVSSWREFWDRDTPIYVSARHKARHYAPVDREVEHREGNDGGERELGGVVGERAQLAQGLLARVLGPRHPDLRQRPPQGPALCRARGRDRRHGEIARSIER